MSKAVICPVCSGKGYLEYTPSQVKGDLQQTCHGCAGKGWVEVGGGDPPYQTMPWYPWWPTCPPNDPVTVTYTTGTALL